MIWESLESQRMPCAKATTQGTRDGALQRARIASLMFSNLPLKMPSKAA